MLPTFTSTGTCALHNCDMTGSHARPRFCNKFVVPRHVLHLLGRLRHEYHVVGQSCACWLRPNHPDEVEIHETSAASPKAGPFRGEFGAFRTQLRSKPHRQGEVCRSRNNFGPRTDDSAVPNLPTAGRSRSLSLGRHWATRGPTWGGRFPSSTNFGGEFGRLGSTVAAGAPDSTASGQSATNAEASSSRSGPPFAKSATAWANLPRIRPWVRSEFDHVVFISHGTYATH